MTTPPSRPDGPPSQGSSPRSIRLAALDDHPIVVEGLVSLITREAGDLVWLGGARTFAELERALQRWPSQPDIVLYDLHLHDGSNPSDGIAALRARGITVVVLTSEVRPIPIRRAVQAGAMGVVLKSDHADRIIDVIRSAAAGSFAASSDLAFVLLTDASLTARLAPRELEALELLADGVPRKLIGARMDPPVSLATVVTYINRVCERYRALGRDVTTAQDALRAAVEDGHLDLPESPRDL
ncbi:MAG: response regulator [Dermatophilaceae bacterium]